ncbi:MAG: hypothetical protein EBS19_12065, partial [Spirochaetia bacterium]|nr:hypothetical protein [Spirochaetia bacterium]
METAKEKIEQTLINIGITPSDAWKEDDDWYLLENNGTLIIFREKEATVESTNELINTINISAPVISISETMPIEFYKEIISINNDIADGTSLQIANNKTVFMNIYIIDEFYTPDFGIHSI